MPTLLVAIRNVQSSQPSLLTEKICTAWSRQNSRQSPQPVQSSWSKTGESSIASVFNAPVGQIATHPWHLVQVFSNVTHISKCFRTWISSSGESLLRVLFSNSLLSGNRFPAYSVRRSVCSLELEIMMAALLNKELRKDLKNMMHLLQHHSLK